jgi:hypothetical protein
MTGNTSALVLSWRENALIALIPMQLSAITMHWMGA